MRQSFEVTGCERVSHEGKRSLRTLKNRVNTHSFAQHNCRMLQQFNIAGMRSSQTRPPLKSQAMKVEQLDEFGKSAAGCTDTHASALLRKRHLPSIRRLNPVPSGGLSANCCIRCAVFCAKAAILFLNGRETG
jgi:hypothetical protein